jgi:hypothetical protein
MEVLLIGAGVIGTVYGSHLAADGHLVSVLAHGAHTDSIAQGGLAATDLATGVQTVASVALLDRASGVSCDLVLIAVRADQLGSVAGSLRGLAGQPALLFFGNNPSGHGGLPAGLPGPVQLGFPGVGGSMVGNSAEYVRISQQPTTLETGGRRQWPSSGRPCRAAGSRSPGRPASMAGWLITPFCQLDRGGAVPLPWQRGRAFRRPPGPELDVPVHRGRFHGTWPLRRHWPSLRTPGTRSRRCAPWPRPPCVRQAAPAT